VRGSCPSPVERGFVVCDMGKKAFFSVYGAQVDVEDWFALAGLYPVR